MRIHVFIIGIALMSLSCFGLGATETSETVFVLKNKNMSLSPYTGMTREHWKEAALYLLEGAFSYVKSPEDPLDFPKQPGKSYPRTPSQEPVARLEALCRTMFLAGPLLKEDPELRVNGILLGDYYRRQLELMLQPGTPVYVPMNPPKKNGGQRLVELGGLALSFMMAPEIFWNPLSQEVKDSLAVRMLSYGEGGTYECNWRFFNVNIMSFFLSQGYHTDKAYLEELLQILLAAYRGDGWYHDNPLFDYYSMWAFQMYGSLWSEKFGKKYYPDYARQFMEHFREIPENYPYMFARDGKMIMWGRSITYRMGTSVPLALTGMLEDPDINYGWMRRIASSTILQFLQHPDFLEDRIPTLGFYGAFEPAIQGYSCRGSVFWMGKLFLALYLPADNPFWNAVENEGAWTDFEKDRVYCKYAEDAHILITDYPNIGASELRSTTSHSSSNYHCVENYNRLSYNSEFPWQADGKNGEVAMSYVVKNKEGKWEPLRNYSFKKYEDGFYCREAWLESDEAVYFQLAELPLPDGILRIDKVSSPSPVEVRMGHYALPEKQGKICESVVRLDGKETYVIDNGVYRLGMTTWEGWKQMEFVHAEGLHPDSRNSVVIDASDRCEGEKVYITLQLWSKSGSKDDDAWNPVSKICFDKSRKQFEVVLKDGNVKRLKW